MQSYAKTKKLEVINNILKKKSTKLTQKELENPSCFYKTLLALRYLLKRLTMTARQIYKNHGGTLKMAEE